MSSTSMNSMNSMNSHWVPGNRITLLENGEGFYPRVFDSIGAAEHEVLLETFIVFDDKVGRELQQALLRAAGRGAKVDVLVDGWGSPDLPPSFTQPLQEAGVKLRSFEPAQRLFGARINMLHRMHRKLRLAKRGGQVFDRTEVDSIAPSARGVELHATAGARIKCHHLIMAAGYESQRWLRRRVAQNRSSYAFVTDPIERTVLGFLGSTLAWESARPYLYLRTTRDGRLLVGGEDDRTDIPARRDRRVESKAIKLASKVQRLFPALPVTPAFSWAGTFAETRDGLPYFGPDARYGPRVHFAMAYGGNGITYSMIGAKLLGDRIERRKHPLGGLFSFDRLR